MPTAVLKDGKVIICKTFGDVEKEFQPVVDGAFRQFQESFVLDESAPFTLEKKEQYKQTVLARNQEWAKWKAIIEP